jgi:hypothetical protein
MSKPKGVVTERERKLGSNVSDPAKAGDDRLLAEFTYAVNTWVSHMSKKAQREAVKTLEEMVRS